MASDALHCLRCNALLSRDPQHYCPSLEEIADACREIRAGWSWSERRRRRTEIVDRLNPADLATAEGQADWMDTDGADQCPPGESAAKTTEIVQLHAQARAGQQGDLSRVNMEFTLRL